MSNVNTPSTDLSRVPTGNLILMLQSLDYRLMDDIDYLRDAIGERDHQDEVKARAERQGWSDEWQARIANRQRTAKTLLRDAIVDVIDTPQPVLMGQRAALIAELHSRGVSCPCGADGESVLMYWRPLAVAVLAARELNRVMCRSEADRVRLTPEMDRIAAVCAERGISDVNVIIRRKTLPA